jgi:LysR family transcriptional regulator, glycine cleavage system transcriptional activator
MADRGLPPLNWLKAFEAAARTLSFTEAARELNVTQAAVSKHVRSLELALRHSLFQRRARSLALTRSAEAYLPKVQDALDRLATGTREVFGNRRSDVLTIRCTVSFAVNWLAPRLPDFMARFPQKPVRILSSVWSAPFDAQAFDLDIQYGTGNWPGLRHHRLVAETITPLCSPLVAMRLGKPDDLARERLLHVLGYQEGWGVWLNAAGARNVDPGQGFQLDTSLMAFELAACGAGVALGRRSLVEKELAAGRLVAPFALEVPIREAFYLLEADQGDLHPDAADFVDWIVAAAAEASDGDKAAPSSRHGSG